MIFKGQFSLGVDKYTFDCTNSKHSDIQIIALFELVKGSLALA